MTPLVVTPQVLLDLFLLCSTWQWESKNRVVSPGTTFTTVNKVVGMLRNLGIITEQQWRELSRDPECQRPFRAHTTLYRATTSVNTLWYTSTFLALRLDVTRKFEPQRLLKNYPLRITALGVEHAKKELEPKYSPLLKKEAYLAELQRW